MTLRDYFKAPFPSAKGFSPYRMPGMAVHLPVIYLFAGLGYLLCQPAEWLWPLLAAYLLMGVYVGRDVAIFAHYAPPLTLLVWGLLLAAISYQEELAAFFGHLPPLLAVAASLALVGAFAAYARWYVREM